MIVTLTLNPALDKSLQVDKLVPEKKMRCAGMQVTAGGGGINVSRAIHELGGKSLALFPAGGINGQVLASWLSERGIPHQPVPIGGDTRESIAVLEESSNRQYRFVLPGPMLAAAELNEVGSVLKALPGMDYLVCSGSLPSGTPDTYLNDLAQLCRQRGSRFIVDTSGAPLRQAMREGVFLIKPNLTELCSLVGKDYLELNEINEAARSIVDAGSCEVLVVSMGPAGALVMTRTEEFRVTPPTVKKRSTVGAGDSMVAGITFMLDAGRSIREAVQFGAACGTAATVHEGDRLFEKKTAEAYYEWIRKQ
jgi:6-phosphofructokinase 2